MSETTEDDTCVECGHNDSNNPYCCECMDTVCDECLVDGMCIKCNEDYE